MIDKSILDEALSRRGFLKIAIGFLNGLIALMLAVPGLGFLLTPVFRKGSASWVKLGAVENFVRAAPQKAVFKYTSTSGYTTAEKSGFVWVVAEDAQNIAVLSAICSHTGCNVAWQTDEQKFVCPCHEGRYDRHGAVLSGPPPRPLTKLPVRIENEQIFAKIDY